MRHSVSVMTKHANTEQSKWFYCEVRKSVTAAVQCASWDSDADSDAEIELDASKPVVSGPVASFFGQQQCSGKVVQFLGFWASMLKSKNVLIISYFCQKFCVIFNNFQKCSSCKLRLNQDLLINFKFWLWQQFKVDLGLNRLTVQNLRLLKISFFHHLTLA